MLDNYRNEIDKIDKELAILFNQRFALVEEIIKYKKNNHLPILDSKREQEIIYRNLKNIDLKYQKYFLEFYTSLLNISKKYQGE